MATSSSSSLRPLAYSSKIFPTPTIPYGRHSAARRAPMLDEPNMVTPSSMARTTSLGETDRLCRNLPSTMPIATGGSSRASSRPMSPRFTGGRNSASSSPAAVCQSMLGPANTTARISALPVGLEGGGPALHRRQRPQRLVPRPRATRADLALVHRPRLQPRHHEPDHADRHAGRRQVDGEGTGDPTGPQPVEHQPHVLHHVVAREGGDVGEAHLPAHRAPGPHALVEGRGPLHVALILRHHVGR